MKLFSFWKRSFKTKEKFDILAPKNLVIGIELDNEVEDSEPFTEQTGIDIVTYVRCGYFTEDLAEKDKCDVLVKFEDRIDMKEGVYCLNIAEHLDLAHEIAKTNELTVIARPVGLKRNLSFSGAFVLVVTERPFKRKKTVAYDVIRWARKADLLK